MTGDNIMCRIVASGTHFPHAEGGAPGFARAQK